MSARDFSCAGFGTKAIHAGQAPDALYGALATPIYQTSTFCFDSVEDGLSKFAKEIPGFIYSRGGNPTTMVLEQKLAFLEGGEDAVVTASGMGAIGAVLVGLLKSGDHVISGNCLYGCSDMVLRETMAKFGVETSFVDTGDLGRVEEALTPRTKIVFLETPANPTMRVTDLAALSELLRPRNIRLAVDNTFAPPPVQYPIKLGADIVVHSVTKYINGHGDVIGGAVIGGAADIALIRDSAVTKLCGSTPSPFNSFLVLRGMQTLELRMLRHCENALKAAQYLEINPHVEKVYYPGLASNPQYHLAKRQMNGLFSGILSFELKDGIKGLDSFGAARKVVNHLKLASIAVSLGDPATLVQHPASMTHGNMRREDRLASGISDGMIRLSAGLENFEDIIADCQEAFSVL